MGTPPASPTSGLTDQLPMYGLMRGPRIERMAKKYVRLEKACLQSGKSVVILGEPQGCLREKSTNTRHEYEGA